ncbi:MAG: DUF6382 domain-containing protein [Lachnospiraceae bacterium]|nr:DUF6382 domain-containing protein [Lachnospiraceae bacterium]
MNVTYKRDINHNYMVWYGGQEVDTDAYAIRMLLQNHIEGLLPCSIQYMDNQTCFYYEITSRQPLNLLCEKRKLEEDDLKEIMKGLVHILNEVKSFLLDVNDLCLDPSYVFWDWNARQITLCYVPGSGWDMGSSLCQFTQYLLECINQDSGGAVVLGYNLYRGAAARELTGEQIYRLLYGKETSEAERIQVSERQYDKEDVRQAAEKTPEEQRRHEEDLDAFFAADEELFGKQKHSPYMVTAITVGIGLAICVALCILLQVDISTDIYLIIGTVLLLVCAVCVVIYRCWKRKTSKEVVPEKSIYDYKMPDIPLNEESDYEVYEKPSASAREETTLLTLSEDVQSAKLISMNPEEAHTICLNRPATIIGKQKQSVDVVLDRKTVSRIHARIKRTDNEYYLEDLNSKNGTFLDQVMLEPGRQYQLHDGVEVQFADLFFTFCR